MREYFERVKTGLRLMSLAVAICCAVALFGLYYLSGLKISFWAAWSSVAVSTAYVLGALLGALITLVFGTAPSAKRTERFVKDMIPLEIMTCLAGILMTTCFSLIMVAKVNGTHIVEQFGTQEITTEHAEYGLVLSMLLLIVMYHATAKKMAKHAKKQIKDMLINAPGTIVAWNKESGKVQLDPFPLPWYKSKPKRTWPVMSSETMSTGDRVKIISADDQLKEIKVTKLA